MISNEELLQKAKQTAEHAYCKYSKFNVGACALFESGNIYTGCNVENASYGLSLCAERNAISTAIAQGEKTRLIKIAIASDNIKRCYPCGACRQWIKEFSGGCNTEIIVENENNEYKIHYINEILPYAFNLI